MPRDLKGRHLRLELRQLGAEGIACIAHLVAGDAAGRAEQLAAMDERPTLLEAKHARLEVGQHPLSPRPAVLEQVVLDLERMGGEIGRRVGKIGLQVIHHIHRSEHPPPVPRIGADVGIDARLCRRREGQSLRALRLHQRAGRQNVR